MMNQHNLSVMHRVVFTVGRITPTGVIFLGTCFLLNKSGLFATASHVTSNDDQNLVIILNENRDINSYQDTSNNQYGYREAKIHLVDSVRDICLIKIEDEVTSNLIINGSDHVGIAQSLDIIGFPHCTDGRVVLTYQHAIVGAKVLIPSADIKSKYLILNIQTRPGQSGSPIFDSLTGNIIAMLIGSYSVVNEGLSIGGINPHTLHQTTHAISAQYINDMIS